MAQRYAVLIIGMMLATMSIPLAAQTIQENLWQTNGSVYATAKSPDETIIYIGGNFTPM